MHTISSKARIWLVLSWLSALAGCVAAREPATEGEASFVGGLPSASLDYSSAGGSGAIGSNAPAGTGGMATLPMAGMISDPIGATGGVGGGAGSGGTGSTDAVAGSGGATGGSSGDGSAAAGGVGGGSAGGDPTGGMDAAGSGGMGGGASAGTLTIDFTSVGNGGEYAPRNVGAVWIETASGTFVKTIARWAGVRAGHLTRWTLASGGWGGGFFFATGGGSADELDAVTSATLRTHQAHNLTWDMQDAMNVLVADGMYRIVIEVTESERVPSVSAEIEFEKGAGPVTLSPPDSGPYSGLSVTYTP